MLNTNQETPIQGALASYVEDPQNQIHIEGIPEELAGTYLAYIYSLPVNEGFAKITDDMRKIKCGLPMHRGTTREGQISHLGDCLACGTNNDNRSIVCSDYAKLIKRGTPCLFMSPKKSDDDFVSTSVPENEVPFFYDHNKMVKIETYLRGGQVTLTNFDSCRSPLCLPMIFRQLIKPVAQGLKEGTMDPNWLKKENWVVKPRDESKDESKNESRTKFCAGCFQSNCGQCLAGTFRNEWGFLKQLSEANGRSPFRVPDVITEMIAGEFNQLDPQLKFLEGQNPNSILVFGLTLSLSHSWMERIKNNHPVNS